MLSCPPADELMEHIQKAAGNKRVYVLVYHVNYWDRQGWKDVFSSPDFPKRQYWCKSLFTSRIYTSQLILNGTAEFVGSDEREIKNALVNALNGITGVMLTVKLQQQFNKLYIQYQVNGKSPQGQLIITLVQKHAESKVNAGENKRRTLVHAQIVRSLSTLSIYAQEQGNVNVTLPAGFDMRSWEVIGFIQDPVSGEMLGAARASAAKG